MRVASVKNMCVLGLLRSKSKAAIIVRKHAHTAVPLPLPAYFSVTLCMTDVLLALLPRPELGPQYGGNRHPIAGGISKLLQLNDPEVVGVFAQLGYVNEPRLSSVLAANYASTLQVGRVLRWLSMLPSDCSSWMTASPASGNDCVCLLLLTGSVACTYACRLLAVQVLVVKNYEAITRLRGIAQKSKFPIPGMLADSLIQVRPACQQCLTCRPSWQSLTGIRSIAFSGAHSTIRLAAVSSSGGGMHRVTVLCLIHNLPSAGIPT